MYVEIVSPDKTLYSGDIKIIRLPGSKGSFEILKNHAPIISTLAHGHIRAVEKDGEEHLFEVSGGVVEVVNNNIIVLAEPV